MTFERLRTGDGSFTLRHPVHGEPYHAREGAESEARAKFILPSRLKEQLACGPVRLLDVGFGLGVNLRAALEVPGNFPLIADALESEREVLSQAVRLFPDDPVLRDLNQHGESKGERHQVTLHLGDMRCSLPNLSGPYDVVFHDPFSPLKNTECWTVDVFTVLHELLKEGGVLVTYSQSRPVRAALQEAGFQIFDTQPVPPHRGGTLALKQRVPDPQALPAVLSPPYRDPGLTADSASIRSEREQRVRAMR